MIRVLVTGARGQVGGEVARALEGRADVVAHDRSTLDITRPGEIAARVHEARPRVIVNCAAYTAVDRAESEEGAARLANAEAPGVLAEEARRCGALLVHFSTDYVFDGAKRGPYEESDATNPLNAYGRTKLAGERAIEAAGGPHLILRTSWVYGPRGGNFARTMLKLARAKDELRIVDDQHGAPTSSIELARSTLRILGGDSRGAIGEETVQRAAERTGLYHATASGETTWFGFAQAIFEAWSRREPGFKIPRLTPISTRDYPTPARRPLNSRLDCARFEAAFGFRPAPWREALAETMSGWSPD